MVQTITTDQQAELLIKSISTEEGRINEYFADFTKENPSLGLVLKYFEGRYRLNIIVNENDPLEQSLVKARHIS